MTSTAKLASLGILFVMSVISGFVVPWFCYRTMHKSHSFSLKRLHLAISAMNSFSGGVFLATAMLALLPEAEEKMAETLELQEVDPKFPFTLAIAGGGLLLVLVLENVVLSLCARSAKRQEKTKHVLNTSNLTPEQDGNQDIILATTEFRCNDELRVKSVAEMLSAEHRSDTSDTNTGNSNSDQSAVRTANTNSVRSLILLLALSIHMLFDGLELGLLEHESDVWSLLGALSLHKILIFISLGLTLVESVSTVKFAVSIGLLSLFSPIGVGIGIAMTAQEESIGLSMASAVLQAVAVGTFLYVTMFEILMKEFHTQTASHRTLMCAATVFGYVLFGGIKYAMPE